MGVSEFGLPKSERVFLQKEIDELFDRDNKKAFSTFSFPIKSIAIPFDYPEAKSKILLSVPKKKIKKAVDRNRIKRLIRESYRLQKHILSQPYKIAFLFVSDTVPTYSKMYKSIGENLKQISNSGSELTG
ncbi:MAG: ribonuclease P protein component [Leadbetterella sp.]